MWDLETMHKLNNQPKDGEKVSSDGRVCTDYVSRPAHKRFYVDQEGFILCAIVVDSIPMQGYGSFGPMPIDSAIRLCALLNNLTKL